VTNFEHTALCFGTHAVMPKWSQSLSLLKYRSLNSMC